MLLKYSIVLRIPSTRSTVGSQPSNVRARVMSGRRTLGSSCGSGLELDRAGPGRKLLDFLGEFEDGHLVGVAEVDRLVEVGEQQPEDPLDQIG